MSSSGRSRNNVDTRLIRFPPRTTMRGGNDIAILHHLYLAAALPAGGQGLISLPVLKTGLAFAPQGSISRSSFFCKTL